MDVERSSGKKTKIGFMADVSQNIKTLRAWLFLPHLLSEEEKKEEEKKIDIRKRKHTYT